jgi:EpsI family protein
MSPQYIMTAAEAQRLLRTKTQHILASLLHMGQLTQLDLAGEDLVGTRGGAVVPSNLRFIAAAILLAGTALFLQARNRDEVVPPRENFASFPHRFGTWVGRDVNIEPDVLQTLGPGDFLTREYRDIAVDDASVDLFVAYFPSQRTGDTLHSPKNCLPGAGWQPLKSSKIKIALPGREPFLVNRYLIAKGAQRGLALYWYWAHGRAVTSEYWAKFYLVEDSIRLNRSDGSMIRVATELEQHETAADAQRRLLSLLNAVFPAIETYIPR